MQKSLIILLLLTFSVVLAKENSTGPGSISIQTIPPNAKLYLDGKYIGRTPIDLNDLPENEYILLLKLPKHANYKTSVNVRGDQRLNLMIPLSYEIYELWMLEYSRAIISSAIIPGKGQIDNDCKRGWGYFFGILGTAGYSYFQYHSYQNADDDYTKALQYYKDESDQEKISARYRSVLKARDDMNSSKNQYEYALMAAGSIWLINMVDIVFFTVDRPLVIENNPKKYSFFLRQDCPGIGLKMNF